MARRVTMASPGRRPSTLQGAHGHAEMLANAEMYHSGNLEARLPGEWNWTKRYAVFAKEEMGLRVFESVDQVRAPHPWAPLLATPPHPSCALPRAPSYRRSRVRRQWASTMW